MTHLKYFSTLLFLLATPALSEHNFERFNLPNCGGHAEVRRNDRQTLIEFEDIEDCSNLTVNGQRIKMQVRSDGHYFFVYTWQPSLYRDRLDMRVHSNSGRTEDRLQIQTDERATAWNNNGRWGDYGRRPVAWEGRRPADSLPVTRASGDSMLYLDEARNATDLPICGGRLRIDVQHQKLIIRLEGSQDCDRVRLSVLNQRPLVMENSRRLDRSCQVWTFHLPEYWLRPGRNSLTLSVQGARQERADLVRYYFSDQRYFFASGGR